MGSGNPSALGSSYGPQITLDVQATACDPSKYLQGDSFIVVQVWNSAANTTIPVQATLVDVNGLVIPSLWQVTPTSDRALNTFTFPLTEGFLMAVVVLAGNTAQLGSTFVRVFLQKAAFTARVILCQGYVSGRCGVSWPFGQLRQPNEGRGNFRSITGTLPAAGAEISEVVPTGALWRLISFKFGLTTSAAVANRVPALTIDDGTNAFFSEPSQQPIVAATTVTMNAIAGGALGYTTSANIVWPVPDQMFLPVNFRIRTVTAALQAADQYTAPQYLVEEFLAP